ncbi:MAG: site-specific DNA-methyltransferase [Planctomycetes bacterium]|nr:site-specific DNA-methyltransferase [Planctomycetota bacterium]
MRSSSNRVYCADCLGVLNVLPADLVDLAYLDPPFNTGRRHAAASGTYRDTWPSLDAYLDFMRLRVAAVRDVLRPSGSILLHCDWRCSHHLRVMLDELFGPQRFVNHLVWAYGLGGSSPRRFARKHDDVLFYSRSDEYYFKPPLVPATSNRMKGELKKAGDVINVPAINNMALERTGYPTQKPLKLLLLLVNACCPPRGVVLDPFCGSGTTLVAAAQTGRRYIGIDVNAEAVRIARRRVAVIASPQADRARWRSPVVSGRTEEH